MFEEILGESAAADQIRAFARRAASVDASVLLTGESGTGKGLVARAIHEASARRRGAFIAVNCAGVPETLFESEFFGFVRGAFTGAQQSHRGLFEQAHGGTLFLDEVGELPPSLQAKLLTVLEEGEVRRLGGERTVRVDARIVAATSLDLERAVARDAFRRDLFHRLLVLAFRLPPLRERSADLDLFISHYLARYARKYGRPVTDLDAAAWSAARAHPWPGNIRQVAHAVEAALLACEGRLIRAGDLPGLLLTHPAPVRPPDAPPDAAPAVTGRYSFFGDEAEERHRIIETLRHCRGNKTRTAAALGMARNTLRAKLRAFETDTAAHHAD